MIIPIITGPTAVGKTALSIKLAKQINGEIISADSMQIYKYMNIGTAKIRDEETEGVPHHLINLKEPEEEYSVADFSIDCRKKINEIIAKGKTPIIIGGTGLYINSILYGLNFEENIDLEFRKKLEDKIKENPEYLEKLYSDLKEIDIETAEKLAPIDSRRIIRALEIYHVTGKTKSQVEKQNRVKDYNVKFKLFVLNLDREELYKRINHRVDIMLEDGLIDEVVSVKDRLSKTSKQALGYKEVIMYLNNEIDYNKMTDLIKQKSRNYAKRQLTWFRKNEAIWLDAKDKEKALNTIIQEISSNKNE